MEYINYIQTDFGELKVSFTTENVLEDEGAVLEASLKILKESKDIQLTDSFLKSRMFFEVTEGETKEDL